MLEMLLGRATGPERACQQQLSDCMHHQVATSEGDDIQGAILMTGQTYVQNCSRVSVKHALQDPKEALRHRQYALD